MAKRWLYSVLFGAVIALNFSGCQRPIGVLGRDKMMAVTKDIILTEAYLAHNQKPDSIATLYYESVLDLHGVSRAKYDSSLVWYGENAHRLNKIYEEIEKSLHAQVALMDTLYNDSIWMERLRFSPDVSLWKGINRLYIPSHQRLFLYDHVVELSDDFVPKDTLEWNAVLYPAYLADSIDIRLQLLISDEDERYYSRLKASSVPDSLSLLRHYFYLPDSIPPAARFTLYFILINPEKELFLDQFYFGKKRIETAGKTEPPVTDIEPAKQKEEPEKELLTTESIHSESEEIQALEALR